MDDRTIIKEILEHHIFNLLVEGYESHEIAAVLDEIAYDITRSGDND